MTCAAVSSWSCFCWLYTASPSLATKNIISLILVLMIWWCPCVRVFSCVVRRGCFLWPMCSLSKTLLSFALLYFVPKAKFACYSRCFLTSYFCIPVPYNKKDIFFVCPCNSWSFLLNDRKMCNLTWLVHEAQSTEGVMSPHLGGREWTLISELNKWGCPGDRKGKRRVFGNLQTVQYALSRSN